MIQPNELRIGNYFHPVSNSNGISIPATAIIHRVGSVDKFGNISVIEHSSDSIMFTHKEVSPIPITPEWLERLGFAFTIIPDSIDNEGEQIIYNMRSQTA